MTASQEVAVDVPRDKGWTKSASFGTPRQMRALLGRSWALQLKQRKSNIARVVMPLLILLTLYILRFTGVIALKQSSRLTKKSCKDGYGNSQLCEKFSFRSAFLNPNGGSVNTTFQRRSREIFSIPSYRSIYYGFNNMYSNNFQYPENLTQSHVWFSGNDGGIISSIPEIPEDMYAQPWNLAPKWRQFKTEDALNAQLLDAMKKQIHTGGSPVSFPTDKYLKSLMEKEKEQFPSLGITFEKASKKEGLEYTQMDYMGMRSNPSIWGAAMNPPVAKMSGYYTGDHVIAAPFTTGYYLARRGILPNAIHSSMLRMTTGNPFASIGSTFNSVPYVGNPKPIDSSKLASSLTTLLFSLATVLLFPQFVHMAVQEKEEKAYEMMRIMGVGIRQYWFSQYIYNMALSLIITVVTVVFCVVTSVPPFSGGILEDLPSHPGQGFVLLLCWDHALVGLGALFTSLFAKGRSAVIITYIFIILSTIGGVVMVTFVDSISTASYIFLPFAFIDGMYRLVNNTRSVAVPCCFLIIGGAIALLLGIFINEMSTASSPIRRWLHRKIETRNNRTYSSAAAGGGGGNGKKSSSAGKSHYGTISDNENNLLSMPLAADTSADIQANSTEGRVPEKPGPTTAWHPSEKEDEDVAMERIEAESGDTRRWALCTRAITRWFRTPEDDLYAVNSVSFRIEKGQCLGLLGPNGAGKSTLISMIHGALRPTSGNIWVSGHDVVDNIESARAEIGCVEQFDCHWSSLTVREHLLFYARLKGATRESEDAVVQRAAEAVQLDGDSFNKASSALSGGQRRLLSLGVASVHTPTVILLDEPTTGLSAHMRRTAWRVIAKLKESSSVLMTTHSMEEAACTADRIAIMVDGRLACVGTPLHLKSRFGSAYLLTLAAPESKADDVQKFMAAVVPSAELHKYVAGVHTFSIPRGSVRISDIFTEIAKPENSFIEDWSFSQASLASVFHAIAGGKGDEE